MLDPVWIALIGIIVTQYLIYKRLHLERVSEKRNEYFIEGHKKNKIVSFCLAQIDYKINVKKNINTIQEIVDNHPYYFSYDFVTSWMDFKISSSDIPSEKNLEMLFNNLDGMESLFSKKFFLEVLGFKLEEFKEYGDALFGRKRITK